jgi:hypothetical protein
MSTHRLPAATGSPRAFWDHNPTVSLELGSLLPGPNCCLGTSPHQQKSGRAARQPPWPQPKSICMGQPRPPSRSCGRCAHWAGAGLGFVVRCCTNRGCCGRRVAVLYSAGELAPAATAINWPIARTRRRSFVASSGPGRSGCVWVPASASPSHFAARNAPENLPTDASGCWRVDRAV